MKCQCPQSGNPHFYTTGDIGYLLKNICVNALNRAILISTDQATTSGEGVTCVNALSRAILISTLPSQNRLFKPLCGPVIAGNCRNSLIINYNKAQKLAEGKLFFEYNLEAFL